MAFFPEACRSVFPIFLSVSGSWPPTSCLVWSQSRLNAALVRSHAVSFSWFHQFGFLYWFMMLFFVCLTGRFFFSFFSAMTISWNIRENLIAPCYEPSCFLQGFIDQLNFVR